MIMFSGNLSVASVCVVLSFSCWSQDTHRLQELHTCPFQYFRHTESLQSVEDRVCNSSKLMSGVLTWATEVPQGPPQHSWFSCCPPHNYNQTTGCCNKTEYIYTEDCKPWQMILHETLRTPISRSDDLSFKPSGLVFLSLLVSFTYIVYKYCCGLVRERRNKKEDDTTIDETMIMSVDLSSPFSLPLTKKLGNKKVKRILARRIRNGTRRRRGTQTQQTSQGPQLE